MKFTRAFTAAVLGANAFYACLAYNPSQPQQTSVDTRRSFLSSAAAALVTAGGVGVGEGRAEEEVLVPVSANDPATDVYFGVGCFWHIQHEFLVAEREVLGRNKYSFTSRTGYAGGTKTDKEGRVCYHNFQSIADYGKMGHGEVVGMTLPQSKIGEFADLYFSLFDPRTKNRVDPMDRGAEYRSLLGLPGGMNHPEYSKVQEAADKAGFTLELGKGNDPDTINKSLVYVYDTAKFPFYQAEVYHQFHNDFQSPPYGRAYNGLIEYALEDGRVKGTGCPDRI